MNIIRRPGTGIAPTNPTSLGRRELNDHDLAVLIGTKVRDLTSQSLIFTAYNVTRSLRADHLDIEFNHERVKKLVHFAMANYFVVGGTYDKHIVDKGYDKTFEYFPVGQLPAPASATPLLK